MPKKKFAMPSLKKQTTNNNLFLKHTDLIADCWFSAA